MYQIPFKTATMKRSLKISPDPKRVATLPCEI